jgi:CheY-like chemotaxis protein
MAFKRALIVDDSRSARMALKTMLEKHGLIVHFAESGEEGLEFLNNQAVDVIFMDHSMPGMDGLQAVSAIKSNPRTAMIPVMMYTAKEGEVYVSQARALGAIGVLPKEVHPAALFEMLMKLGLVTDRRNRERPPKVEVVDPDEAAESAEIDRQYERQAIGMSVQALVTRVLEDQHLTLRSDVLKSNREFAKQVAEEIFRKQQSDAALSSLEEEPRRSHGRGAMLGVAALVILPALIFLVLFLQMKEQRDAALAESTEQSAAVQAQLSAAESETSNLLSDMDAQRREGTVRFLGFLGALQWALNRDSRVPFGETMLNDARIDRLNELLTHLLSVGFEGTVRLELHLGQFCLVDGEDGTWQLAPPETPVGECRLLGHPLDNSFSASERQSLAFANFLAVSPLINESGIDVEVVAHGRSDSVPRIPYSARLATAGEWNAVAERNNRVEVILLPGA